MEKKETSEAGVTLTRPDCSDEQLLSHEPRWCTKDSMEKRLRFLHHYNGYERTENSTQIVTRLAEHLTRSFIKYGMSVTRA